MSSIRTALSFAAEQSWHIQQVDVNTAFLYAHLKEEIYVKLPEGLHLIPATACHPDSTLQHQSSKKGQPIVGRLLRALYGLKQAPRKWYDELTRILKKQGYQPTYNDPGAYT